VILPPLVLPVCTFVILSRTCGATKQVMDVAQLNANKIDLKKHQNKVFKSRFSPFNRKIELVNNIGNGGSIKRAEFNSAQ
jgi:hypothetical protein